MDVITPIARWSIPLDLEAVAPIVEQAGAFLERHGLSGRPLFTAQLALEEIVSNAVRHSGDDVHDIDVIMIVDREGVSLTVEDDGRPFDPLHEGPELMLDAPLEERTGGGMGLHLVRSMVDRLDYVRDGQVNRVNMRVERLAS